MKLNFWYQVEIFISTMNAISEAGKPESFFHTEFFPLDSNTPKGMLEARKAAIHYAESREADSFFGVEITPPKDFIPGKTGSFSCDVVLVFQDDTRLSMKEQTTEFLEVEKDILSKLALNS